MKKMPTLAIYRGFRELSDNIEESLTLRFFILAVVRRSNCDIMFGAVRERSARRINCKEKDLKKI